jgi:hypothetical protein
VGSSSDSATVQLGLRENLSQFALLVVINAANLPAAPPNFASIVELNEAGEFPPTDPTDLEAGANRCAGR